jgi:hypothetical protein
MLGWDTLQRILSTFYSRFAFTHPEPKDFFAVVNEVSGRDLTWFFDQVYRSSSVFDYSVDAFTSERVSDRGYFGDSGRGRFGVRTLRRRYRTTLVVRRGDGCFGQRPRRFENGQEQRWADDASAGSFRVDWPVRAVTAEAIPSASCCST